MSGLKCVCRCAARELSDSRGTPRLAALTASHQSTRRSRCNQPADISHINLSVPLKHCLTKPTSIFQRIPSPFARHNNRPRSQSCEQFSTITHHISLHDTHYTASSSSPKHRLLYDTTTSNFRRIQSLSTLDQKRETRVVAQSESKSALKDWILHLSAVVDTRAVNRLLSSLHVDVPKYLPNVSNILPSVTKRLPDVTKLWAVRRQSEPPLVDREVPKEKITSKSISSAANSVECLHEQSGEVKSSLEGHSSSVDDDDRKRNLVKIAKLVLNEEHVSSHVASVTNAHDADNEAVQFQQVVAPTVVRKTFAGGCETVEKEQLKDVDNKDAQASTSSTRSTRTDPMTNISSQDCLSSELSQSGSLGFTSGVQSQGFGQGSLVHYSERAHTTPATKEGDGPEQITIFSVDDEGHVLLRRPLSTVVDSDLQPSSSVDPLGACDRLYDALDTDAVTSCSVPIDPPTVVRLNDGGSLVQSKTSANQNARSVVLPQPGSLTDGYMTTASRMVRQMKSYLPLIDSETVRNYLPTASAAKESVASKELDEIKAKVREQAKVKSKDIKPSHVKQFPRSIVDRKTRVLVFALREAQSPLAQLARIEELSRHLIEYPESARVAVKGKVLPCLLRLRASKDSLLREAASEALVLTGYNNPVRGRGIRILSIDGGGTKGLIAIEIMKQLESATGRPIHDLFDYICGVSTGALIAVMAGVYRVPLNDTEKLYKEFSSQMFARNKLIGVGKFMMSHSYYDTKIWEKILQENIGFKSFLETARDPKCPKSHYKGSLRHKLWEAIRASSAAPGYYEEFELAQFIHQDGGLLTNNPAAIAIHEAQLLWPKERLQCVVSLGTGKYEPTRDSESSIVSNVNVKSKLVKIVQSATDTEAVHTILLDLLPPATYFRFNPYMSEDFQLDEIRLEKWEQMKLDTKMYCRKNQLQIDLAAQRLVQLRPSHRRVADWCNLKWDMIG